MRARVYVCVHPASVCPRQSPLFADGFYCLLPSPVHRRRYHTKQYSHPWHPFSRIAPVVSRAQWSAPSLHSYIIHISSYHWLSRARVPVRTSNHLLCLCTAIFDSIEHFYCFDMFASTRRCHRMSLPPNTPIQLTVLCAFHGDGTTHNISHHGSRDDSTCPPSSYCRCA